MTPMIDVVFQLIIFFLVSSHLAKQEARLPLDLPAAESGIRSPADAAPRMIVNVRPDGTLSTGGQPVSPEQLQDRLARRRSEQGEDLQLRIRSDRSVAYRNVKPILRAATQAGIWNVHFVVIHSRDQS